MFNRVSCLWCKRCRLWADDSFLTSDLGLQFPGERISIDVSPVQKLILMYRTRTWMKHTWNLEIITKTRLFKYTENFTTKKWKFSEFFFFYIFHISAQNIDNCGYLLEPPRWGGSNKFPQSMFLSRNKKNNVYPCKPQFYYIKVGFKGVKII